jgi:aryl-alcohol dehydrogenase-like predicted oxidoreductase
MPSILGTKLEPSRICLGTAGFGSDIPKEEAFAVLDAYVEAGGNFLDTAHIYAAWLPNGEGMSERTLGEWMQVNGSRNDIVLATKGGHPPLDDLSQGRCGREHINQHLNESLERLGVDHVDLYWLHRDEPKRDIGEIVEALAACVKDGRIQSFGGSNWSWERLAAANAYAEAHGLPGMVASQPGWAAADRGRPVAVEGMFYPDEATIRTYAEAAFPVVAYSAQATGWFGEANCAWAKGGFAGDPPQGDAYDSAESRDRLLRCMALAKEAGCTANQIALAYLLNQPFPVYPIVGTRKPARIKEALAAIDLVIDPASVVNPDGA